MRKFGLAVVLTVLIVSLSSATASASATVVNSTSENSPVGSLFVGCAETVQIVSGVEHIRSVAVLDANRGIHQAVLHSRFEAVEGIGLSTGDRYYLRGSETSASFTASDFEGGTAVFVAQVVLVSKGSSPNIVARIRGHLTLDANGNLRVNYFEAEVFCR